MKSNSRRWARTERVILHEMAHWIVRYSQSAEGGRARVLDSEQYDRNHASHGKEFAAVLLELVRLQLGAEATKALKASYKAKRVVRDKQPQPIHRKAQKVA
jgi:putative metallohydrolase (TIGR04338 family)